MGLADYYGRGALAAAQALQGGFEDTRFRALLEATPLGISFDTAVSASPEGQALLDLSVRIAARLFPAIQLDPEEGSGGADRAAELARAINPNIELVEDSAEIGVALGSTSRTYKRTVYAGSDGWDALISSQAPQTIGASQLPFGAGAAACLALAEIFREIFLAGEQQEVQQELRYSTFKLGAGSSDSAPTKLSDSGQTALIGAGAIGNAAVWALARAPIEGTLQIIDPEPIELSNLQRYVLAVRSDEGAQKAVLAGEHLAGSLTGIAHPVLLAEFLTEQGYECERMLLALDSARDRRSAQASLPHWIANAWTQPGDLGVSVHPSFASEGACVSCLYLQDQELRSEDELIAEALGISDQLGQVRQMLVTDEGLQMPLAELIAQRLGQPPPAVAAFAQRPIRELYVQGICGGAVLPLGSPQAQRADVHVPLAHQSALAGVLLAAAYARSLSTEPVTQSEVARLDVMRPAGPVEPQPSRKRGDGRCICEDPDFLAVYADKWPGHN
jgi:hypothetical protein